MAIYCGESCEKTGPVCDFCTRYDFNGNSKGEYTGEGHCRFHDKPREPEDGCDDFVCSRLQEP